MRAGGRKTTERAALAAVTLLAALLRLWALGGKTIWLDEAFSIWVADHALPEILRFVASVDHHPPLYYVLLHDWQARFGDSADAVRSLSALLSIITVPILYAAGKRLVGTPAALMAACVLVLSPFHVRYAQEARMYALMTFFAAVALLCLAVYLTETRPGNMQRRAAMAGLAVAQALLMLSHNTAAFLFPAALNVGVLWAYWQVRNRKGAKDAKNEKQELPEQKASTAEDAEEKGGDEGENGVMFPVSAQGGGALRALRETGFLRGWAMVQGAALLLWLPWAPSFTAQAQTVYQGFWIQTPTLGSVWLAFHHFNLAFPQDGFAGALLWDLLFWGPALVGWRALNRRGSTGNLLGTLFLLPAAIELVFSVRRPIFYDRTLIWVTLPYYLLIGAGLWQGIAHSRRAIDAGEKVRGRLGMVTSAGAALVLVGLSVYSLGAYYIGFEKEDWRGAAAYVGAQAVPGDLVLFTAPWVQIPFDYYYAREQETPVERHGAPADFFSAGELEPAMRPEDLPALRDLMAGRETVWLVYSHEWYTDADGLALHELQNGMDLAAVSEFNGVRVFRFTRWE